MRTLAIECATEACSVALFEHDLVMAAEHRVLGRGHAEQLVPMIARLPERGKSQRILVSLGPGSFTGVRIGIATARALGFAWQAEVIGFPTLALVAAMARAAYTGPVTVCMTGGHGEWFVQDFGDDGLPEVALGSFPPAAAQARMNHAVIAGSQASTLATPDQKALGMLPDARFALSVPGQLLTDSTSPIYGRAPDARLPG